MSAMGFQITGVSICLLNRLRITGLREGNQPVIGGFPSQRASNAENVSISWRHHAVQRRQLMSNYYWFYYHVDLVNVPKHMVSNEW